MDRIKKESAGPLYSKIKKLASRAKGVSLKEATDVLGGKATKYQTKKLLVDMVAEGQLRSVGTTSQTRYLAKALSDRPRRSPGRRHARANVSLSIRGRAGP